MYDIVVIGGGVIGGTVFRELTKYQLNVCLVEKENDVAMGQSKANSGIVHAGFDAAIGSLKAKFNVLGNKAMASYAEELGVKYRNNGSLVVAFSDEEYETLKTLKSRGEENGVDGLVLIGKDELKKLEPSVNDTAIGALLAKTGGIVCPYELTIAAIGNAMDNGGTLITDFEVEKICNDGNCFAIYSSDSNVVKSKIIINAAGINSGKIAALAGDNTITVKGRKGEYVLLDRESGNIVSHTLFFTPTAKGKGILVSQTVDGNVILGPTAEEVDVPSTETTPTGLSEVLSKASKMLKNVPVYNTITSFAGVRAYSDKHDFIIEESKIVKGLINLAGIESPGLTSAPAIAKYVAEELVGKIIPLQANEKFNGRRKPDYFFKNLSVEEKNEIIKKDKSYGKIICRCENITEGEIIRVIRENPKPVSVDAVKRRTRAGMGRCQGGFCQPYVAEIIAKELNIPLEQVLKSGKKSNLLVGETK